MKDYAMSIVFFSLGFLRDHPKMAYTDADKELQERCNELINVNGYGDWSFFLETSMEGAKAYRDESLLCLVNDLCSYHAGELVKKTNIMNSGYKGKPEYSLVEPDLLEETSPKAFDRLFEDNGYGFIPAIDLYKEDEIMFRKYMMKLPIEKVLFQFGQLAESTYALHKQDELREIAVILIDIFFYTEVSAAEYFPTKATNLKIFVELLTEKYPKLFDL